MNHVSQVIARYRYTDKTSWGVVNQDHFSANELIATLTGLESDPQKQLESAILAFHHIWNHQNTDVGHQIVKKLLEVGDETLHPFFYFLESKFYYFKGDYLSSLAFLNKAEQNLKPNINGNSDYRKLLTCIGSINNTDPLNNEYAVMKAIIANDKGNNYAAIHDHEKALEAFNLALSLQAESYATRVHANIAYTHRCMGKAYEANAMPTQALEQYHLAHSIANVVYEDKYHPEAVKIRKALEF